MDKKGYLTSANKDNFVVTPKSKELLAGKVAILDKKKDSHPIHACDDDSSGYLRRSRRDKKPNTKYDPLSKFYNVLPA